MAQPQNIRAVRTRFTTSVHDKETRELIEAMQDYLITSGDIAGKPSGKTVEDISKVIEQKLATLYGGDVTGGNKFAIPDLRLPDITADRLAAALGIDVEDARELEVKSKQKTLKPSKKTTLKFGEYTPSQAGTAYKEGLVGGGMLGYMQNEAMTYAKTAEGKEALKEKGYEKLDLTKPENVLKAIRTKIGGGKNFLGYILKYDKELWNALYNKAKNLVINRAVLSYKKAVIAVDSINIFFPRAKFKHPPFTTEVKDKALHIILSKSFEKKLIKDLDETAPAILAANSKQLIAGLDATALNPKKTLKKEWRGSKNQVVEYTLFTGSSIPMAILGIKKGKDRKKRKTQAPQKFISGAQLTALVQKRLAQVMPQGPRRGPPLSPTIMTNRTGRFRRSIHVVPRYRENVMRFMYDPIYMSLINTPRNPDTLISNTIREVVQGLFGRQFAILRGM